MEHVGGILYKGTGMQNGFGALCTGQKLEKAFRESVVSETGIPLSRRAVNVLVLGNGRGSTHGNDHREGMNLIEHFLVWMYYTAERVVLDGSSDGVVVFSFPFVRFSDSSSELCLRTCVCASCISMELDREQVDQMFWKDCPKNLSSSAIKENEQCGFCDRCKARPTC